MLIQTNRYKHGVSNTVHEINGEYYFIINNNGHVNPKSQHYSTLEECLRDLDEATDIELDYNDARCGD